MELNAEQIIKALECCLTVEFGGDCPFDCPYAYNDDCENLIFSKSLTLINSQEQRIKELTEENERLRAENAKYEAENHAEFNKWLKLEEATKRHHAELFEEAKIAVKEDTVRKMHSMLCEGRVSNDNVVIAANQVAKEILEGCNGTS